MAGTKKAPARIVITQTSSPGGVKLSPGRSYDVPKDIDIDTALMLLRQKRARASVEPRADDAD